MTKTRAIYVENYGCTSNKYDLEIMLGLLEQAGHMVVADPSEADVFLINTCAVKKASQDRMLHRIGSLRGKPLIVSGCLPKIDLRAIERAAPDYYAVMDPQSIAGIANLVEHADQAPRNLKHFSDKPPLKPTLPKIRMNRFVEIVQIAEGCLGDCSYCCARLARGCLTSFPKKLIVERVADAVSFGAREIWLTAQDTGAYGIDMDTNLTDLLEDLIQIPGDFKLRLGMMNPNFAVDMLEDLCEILESPRAYKFLHVPVQSGSDEVLKDMRRRYQVDEFIRLVENIRSRIPNITLSTDLIVGYPTETDEDFELTIDLLDETKPDITNISRYTRRPRTTAAQLDPIPPNIVTTRCKTISMIGSKMSLESNRRMIRQIHQLTVTDKTRQGKPIGRTDNYKRTIVNGDKELGSEVEIQVTSAHKRYLEAVPTHQD